MPESPNTVAVYRRICLLIKVTVRRCSLFRYSCLRSRRNSCRERHLQKVILGQMPPGMQQEEENVSRSGEAPLPVQPHSDGQVI